MKKVANVVFYVSKVNGEVIKEATIFYNDGTYEDVSKENFDRAVEAAAKKAEDLGVSGSDAKRLVNTNNIYTMSKAEFLSRKDEFISKKTEAEEEKVEPEIIEEPARKEDVEPEIIEEPAKKEESAEPEKAEESSATDIDPVPSIDGLDTEELGASTEEIIPEVTPEIVTKPKTPALEDETLVAECKETETKKKKPGFFKRLGNKFKAALAIITAGVIGLGAGGCGAQNERDSSSKTTARNTKNSYSTDNALVQNPIYGPVQTNKTNTLYVGDKDLYDGYTFDQLLNVSRQPQINAMRAVKETADEFNRKFANRYIENETQIDGKFVKANLTFDELTTLQQAYNDYSKDEIKEIYNGSEVRADKMDKDYKAASLQLMSAYIIERSDRPVDMSQLINSTEGKFFYNKYHKMFLEAKEATDKEDKLAKVKAFFDAVKADYPITEDIREVGISHRSAYESLESYKLSVAPMIAAAEMLFQNLGTDYTLQNSQIDFLNDAGLCNYAMKTFERIETIVLTTSEDNEIPLYDQYKKAIGTKTISEINDQLRDLSKLKAFQDAVNWHFEEFEASSSSNYSYSTKSQTKTTYRYEEKTTTKPIPESEKAKVDAQIAQENAAAKAEGEKQAAVKKAEIQAEEDKKAEEIRQEVARDAEDLQARIQEANTVIDRNNSDTNPSNNTPVNEADLGHGVDFDDDHSDSQGNLDPSVKDITTDSSNAYEADDQLPDPNAMGAMFDAGQSTYNAGSTFTESGYTAPSNEQLVDEYITNTADSSADDVISYQFQLHN